MRILWLTKGLGRGGAERLLVDAAHLLEREDCELHIAYLLPWKSDLVEEARASGATVTCLGAGPKAIGWPLRLAGFLRRERFDVIHTHSPLPAAWARLVDRRARFVHTEHNMWPRYRPLTRLANAITYRRNSRVVAVSAGVATSIGPRWLGRDVEPEIVLHGVAGHRAVRDQATRDRLRAELGFDASHYVIGTVGNFTAKKDHANLLTAFEQVLALAPQSRLVMVGSGPLEAATHELAAQLGVTPAVVFAGKRSDVPELLSAFDVFTMSSKFEGLPIAMLEAMATGIPVVATSVGGIPEAITHEHTGLLVEPERSDQLAAALHALSDDPGRRAKLATAGAARSADFDLAEAVRTIDSMYEVAT